MTSFDWLSRIIRARTAGRWSWYPPMNPWDHCAICLQNGGNILNTTSYGKMRDDATFVVTMENVADQILAVIEAAEALMRSRVRRDDRIGLFEDLEKTLAALQAARPKEKE